MGAVLIAALYANGILFALAAQLPTLTPRDSAFHALNRLAYGARPAEASDASAKAGDGGKASP